MTTPSDISREFLGNPGRMISGSKGRYRHENPTHFVVFNANVCTKADGKIWYGDLDITRDAFKIKDLAKALGTTVYVLYEMDARFENEDAPKLERAVFLSNGIYSSIGLSAQSFVEVSDHKFVMRTRDPMDTVKPTSVYDVNDFQEFKLPKMQTFQSKRAKISPYERLMLLVGRKLGGIPKGHLLNPGAIYLREDDSNTLDELTKTWLRRFHTGEDEYATEKTLMWLSLDISPAMFQGTPEWTTERCVYVHTKNAFVKKGPVSE